jgi:hypothetical protein
MGSVLEPIFWTMESRMALKFISMLLGESVSLVEWGNWGWVWQVWGYPFDKGILAVCR